MATGGVRERETTVRKARRITDRVKVEECCGGKKEKTETQTGYSEGFSLALSSSVDIY